MVEERKLKLVHITTVPETLSFLHGQVGYMQGRGIEVHAVSSPGAMLDAFGCREGITVHAVEMPRRITLLRDLRALYRLRACLRLVRPDVVHAHTPKGGLLGMIGAWSLRVPLRIYHIHGLPYMTAQGSRRLLLRWTEKVACRLAHQVLCVSRSIRNVAVNDGLCPAPKVKVLLGGSINGVDCRRYDPRRFAGERSATRARYGVPPDAEVLGFVGRVVSDKGVPELVETWRALREEFPRLHLLMVGPFETQDPLPVEAGRLLRSDPRVHLTGFVEDPAPLYAAIDIVVLPTHREGFPVVPLEAAAMRLPVVATTIPGCVDAVHDGVTGTLVPPREPEALAAAIRAYLLSPALRLRHGRAGRRRVRRDFRPERLWQATYEEYRRLLEKRRIPLVAATPLK